MGYNHRADVRAATASATDALWRHAAEQGVPPCELDTDVDERSDGFGMTEHEARVLNDLMGFDPECRFAKASVLHQCTTNQGQLVRPGQSCWMEARVRLAEQAVRA